MPLFIAAQHNHSASPAWLAARLATALAWLAHLSLADAQNPAWLLPNLIACAALPLLYWRPAFAWPLLALAALHPLLFGGDVLTQSTLLALWAASAAIAHMIRQPDDALTTWRLSTAATYALAAWHKLNTGWMDPDTSCALYGWREVADHLHLPHTLAPPGLPILILATEAAIALLLLTGRHRAAWPIACALHLTMTWTLAPAFALVMLAGHTAFLTARDLDDLTTRLRAHKATLLALTSLGVLTTCLLHRGPPDDLTMLPREALLWALLWLTLPDLRLVTSQRPPRARWAAALALAFILRAAAAPYLGLEVQHSAAMLSNLRIDRGCWNHLLVPEAVRLRDDYIRIDHASLGAPDRHPAQRDALLGELWDVPRLRTAAHNWCKAASAHPISLSGTAHGDAFTIENLCAPGALDALSSRAGMFGGPERFPRYLRFQKNLTRACPTACIH